MNFSTLSVASFSMIALLGAGCGGEVDPNEEGIAELRLDPVGTETMSTLILQLPTGTCLPGGSCARPLAVAPTLKLDNTTMSLGGTGLRVLPGAHTLTVGDTSTALTLVAGATRTMVVPVVKQICTNAEASPLSETEFGRQPSLRNASCPAVSTLNGAPLTGIVTSLQAYSGESCNGTYLYQLDRNTTFCSGLSVGGYTTASVIPAGGSCIDVPNREWKSFCDAFVQHGSGSVGLGASLLMDTAVVPGTYVFELETATGPSPVTHAIAEGAVQNLDFTLPVLGAVPARFNTRITFNDPRQLPDATVATITSGCERNYSVPATASGTLLLRAFVYPECTYQLNIGGRVVTLDQAIENAVRAYRLDVSNVVVTREDNTTYSTTGTYEVYFGGNKVAGPFNTNTGIDLLGGAYEVVVQYQTAAGLQTNRYNLTF